MVNVVSLAAAADYYFFLSILFTCISKRCLSIISFVFKPEYLIATEAKRVQIYYTVALLTQPQTHRYTNR